MAVMDAPADGSVVGGSVSLAEVSLERLEAQICALAARRAADECQWLELIAEFDRREGYAVWECTSTAMWLSWHCGLSLVAGRERVRVARALEGCPLVRDEFSAGRVSYSKVRAVTRVVTPATEDTFVKLAKAATGAQLDKICAASRRLDRRAKNYDELVELQRLAVWHDDDTMWNLRAVLVPEDGALVEAALASACEHLANRQGDQGACRSDASAEAPTDRPDLPGLPVCMRRPSRLDGLLEMARSYLANQSVSPEVERRHLVMLVDVGVVSSQGELGINEAGRCILNGQRLDPDTARRLGFSAPLTQILIDHRGLPLSVGRKSRRATPAQRLALMVRDQDRCQYPGCHHRRVDAHHIQHWENLGLTDLINLLLFCGRHHRVVHRKHLHVRLDPDHGGVEIRRPDGTLITAHHPDPDNAPLPTHIADDALHPGEQGTRLDLDHILTGLATETEQAAR